MDAQQESSSNCMVIGTETVVLLHGGEKALPIPYAFTIGAVSFVGTLYLKDPLDRSYTDGAFFGAVNGTYHIDKDDADACGDNGLLKACIKIDFSKRKLHGRICTRKITGGWDCSSWKEIASW